MQSQLVETVSRRCMYTARRALAAITNLLALLVVIAGKSSGTHEWDRGAIRELSRGNSGTRYVGHVVRMLRT